MSIPDTHWRLMTLLDLPAVEAIAAIVHPGFYERPEIFAERLQLYPDGARLLECDGKPAGYVLSHPWHDRAVPALDSLLEALPQALESYYVHDLALLPEARRTGAGARLVAMLAEHAERAGFARMSLVAVNASMDFWRRQGFVAQTVPELAAKLLSYEDAAVFMERRLG